MRIYTTIEILFNINNIEMKKLSKEQLSSIKGGARERIEDTGLSMRRGRRTS